MKVKTIFKKWYVSMLAILILLGGIGGSIWLLNLIQSENIDADSGLEIVENQKEPETIEELLVSSSEDLKIEAVDNDVAE